MERNGIVARSVSVVIVAHHSRPDLELCLPTIFEQSRQPLEVIVVDNCPADGTSDWLRSVHSSVTVVESPANLGYAGGSNLGAQRASGELLFFLNPDTELWPGAIASLVAAAGPRPRAIITAKLMNPDGSVNACGLDLHCTGLATCRGLGDDSAAYPGLHRVALLSGAALVIAREVFEELGGFDDEYFMYYEDVDLSLRARLAGLTLYCDGRAMVTHRYDLAMSPRKFHLLERNRLLTMFKVFEAGTLRRLLLPLLFTELLKWAYAAAKGPRYLAAALRAYAYLWAERGRWLAARSECQKRRLLPDADILRDATARLPLDQLVPQRQLRDLVAIVTRPLYAAAMRLASPE